MTVCVRWIPGGRRHALRARQRRRMHDADGGGAGAGSAEGGHESVAQAKTEAGGSCRGEPEFETVVELVVAMVDNGKGVARKPARVTEISTSEE